MWNSPLKKGDRVEIPGGIELEVTRKPEALPIVGMYGVYIRPIRGKRRALKFYGFCLWREAILVHTAPSRFKNTPILSINGRRVETLESHFFLSNN